jgi:hypothetical protein
MPFEVPASMRMVHTPSPNSWNEGNGACGTPKCRRRSKVMIGEIDARV